jgi:biopolymer transport protein ExbD
VSKRRRRRRAIIVPVVSMGDIAFLLIIFFVLCSNIAREAGITVEPPVSADLDQVDESTLVVVIDAENQIYFQGRKVHSAGSLETEIADRLRDATSETARRVLFRCDQAVDRSIFEPAMDAVTRAGGIVVAVGEKSKPTKR